jgi:hypothetical protein
MEKKAPLGNFAKKFGESLAAVGFTIALISGSFCLLSEPTPPSANGWLIAGVGTLFLGSVVLGVPVVLRGLNDLRTLWTNRRRPTRPPQFLNRN